MYIQLVSVHGLVRGTNIEMGRNADTGGQVRYVIELAKTLAARPGVEAVDLFTRRIRDRQFDDSYTQDIESLAPNCRIVRIPCGSGRYVRKEKLWPLLDELIDGMIAFTRRQGMTPAVVHGHYADGGYVAMEVASVFGVPFVFTGHSLGKPKLEYLLSQGWSHEKANDELTIDHRIQIEHDCLSAADLVVVSTRHERDTQWGMYHEIDSLPFEVIPPGTDLDRFFPYYNYDIPGALIDEHFKQARVRMMRELSRFFFQNDKPLILAVCRPDRRKNIGALVEAFGRSSALQSMANLAVFAGIREDINNLPENEQQVLTDLLLAMDRYNLYGKMAIPKRHDSELEVPELYRLAASSRGVFVNSAFIELFGLTSIESLAVGLPFVATHNGGPQDIVANCQSGTLVDVTNVDELTSAITHFLTDADAWQQASNNGINRVREFYTWDAHCDRYLQLVRDINDSPDWNATVAPSPVTGKRMGQVESLLICDIDNTLIGDSSGLERLREILSEHRSRLGFGIASGRAVELVKQVLGDHGIYDIDVAITSVGSEIYYGPKYTPDKGYASHVRHKWLPDAVRDALAGFSFLHPQTAEFAQREFKVSYDVDQSIPADEMLRQVHEALAKTKSAYSLIFSHHSFLDVLPHRASKGKAIRYVANKWNIPLKQIATAGDSGNDYDMLTGQTAGIVVGNYDAELEPLRDAKSNRVYFAQGHHAHGIVEGLKFYRLISA